MTMYQKIKELEILVNSGNSLKLDQLSGQNRIVTQIKEGKIIYTHGVGGSKDSLGIDLLYKTYFILQAIGELSVRNLENIDKNYTINGTPCNAVMFMLLMNYFFGKQISGSGTKGDPYLIKW